MQRRNCALCEFVDSVATVTCQFSLHEGFHVSLERPGITNKGAGSNEMLILLATLATGLWRASRGGDLLQEIGGARKGDGRKASTAGESTVAHVVERRGADGEVDHREGVGDNWGREKQQQQRQRRCLASPSECAGRRNLEAARLGFGVPFAP